MTRSRSMERMIKIRPAVAEVIILLPVSTFWGSEPAVI